MRGDPPSSRLLVVRPPPHLLGRFGLSSGHAPDPSLTTLLGGLLVYRLLLQSPFAVSIVAPYALPELGIEAGDVLRFDPETPDIVYHGKKQRRVDIEAAIRQRLVASGGVRVEVAAGHASHVPCSPVLDAPSPSVLARPHLRLIR